MIKTETAKDRKAYSVEEMSETTSLSKSFIRKQIRTGKLKAQLFGRRRLILAEDLENYLKGGNGHEN